MKKNVKYLQIFVAPLEFIRWTRKTPVYVDALKRFTKIESGAWTDIVGANHTMIGNLKQMFGEKNVRVYDEMPKRHEGKQSENIQKFIDMHMIIGTDDMYDILEVLDERKYKHLCRDKFECDVRVRLCKVTNKKKTYTFTALVADGVDISEQMKGSFGKQYHMDEADTLKLGCIDGIKEFDMLYSDIRCNWPIAIIAVTPNFYKL